MKFIEPDRLSTVLKEEMAAYERYLLSIWPAARVLVHSDYRAGDSGQHGLGTAVDFHVEGVAVPAAWLALERFVRFTGIGFYPNWSPQPGFHADVRKLPIKAAYRARWQRNGADYVAFDLAKMKEVSHDSGRTDKSV